MEGDAEAPGGMWSEVGTDGRSVVAAPSSFGRGVLLVTGARHPVGSAPSEVALAEGLAAWARRTLPVGAEIARWSGQDYQSHNLVPFVGGMPRGLGRLRFATGYAGWGLTNAPAAAMRLSDEIRGVSRSDRPQWMRTIGTRMTVPADLGRGIGEAARRAGVAAGGVRRGGTRTGQAARRGRRAGVAAGTTDRGGVDDRGRDARGGRPGSADLERRGTLVGQPRRRLALRPGRDAARGRGIRGSGRALRSHGARLGRAETAFR